MPSINTPASKHAGPATTMGWQWLPYSNAILLAALRRAIRLIDQRIKGYKPCNAAFKALPSGRTFAQVWSDPSIWLNYDPDRAGHRFGVTHSIGGIHNISITQYSLSMENGRPLPHSFTNWRTPTAHLAMPATLPKPP